MQVSSLVDYILQFPAANGSFGPPAPADLGSPHLQPPAVWNLELGYDRGLPEIGSTIRSAVFVQRNDNLLAPPGLANTTVLPSSMAASVAQSIGYGDAVGGDLGIQGKSQSGFRWNASYTFKMIYDHTSVNQPIIVSSQAYLTGTPMSIAILGGGCTWEKLEVDIQGRWQSRFTDYQSTFAGLTPVYISDYITSLMRVGYNLADHVTLALTAQQFNQSRLVESAGPPVERSIIGSVGVHF